MPSSTNANEMDFFIDHFLVLLGIVSQYYFISKLVRSIR